MQSFALGLVRPRYFAITGCTGNLAAVVITVASHTFISGDVVTVKGMIGNTNANGTFYATVTPTTIALYSDILRTVAIVGNGAATYAGTYISAPTRLTPATNDNLPQAQVCKLMFHPQPLVGTGILFVGLAGLNQGNLMGLLRILNPPPATGILDYWELDGDGCNIFNLSDYWIDAVNTSSEGVVVSYYRR